MKQESSVPCLGMVDSTQGNFFHRTEILRQRRMVSKNHTDYSTFAFLILLVCCGCVPIPYRAVVRPGGEGIIADVHTRQPIAGATITMASTNYYMCAPADHQLVAVIQESASDGMFTIPPEQAWRVELIPNFAPNDRRIHCSLHISHPSYEPAQIDFRLVDETLFWPLPRMTNLATIYLTPLPE
jgi:hypothetical protein